jgi:hypothetical protein
VSRRAAVHINLCVTNVPGLTSTLYVDGARLVQAVPLAPLVAGVRLADDSRPHMPRS